MVKVQMLYFVLKRYRRSEKELEKKARTQKL